ncbi:MAG: hypothetical protein NZ518_00970 [Dehalococcoidia bacterium]|nr:hypothetical protein [Dehalococcoidia bacterium]
MNGEWWIDDPRVRAFVGAVTPIFAADRPIADRLAEARPLFRNLLLTDGWLPDAFRRGDPQSGMGSQIGTWLLYRAEDRELTLFALVVEPGAQTPVHDHLRWGLVGVYDGEQLERVYRPTNSSGALALAEERVLARGDMYDLIPPRDDIHSVMTISPIPSISIHLLGGDIGCLWRHQYDVEAGLARPFRSGYSNAGCPDDRLITD